MKIIVCDICRKPTERGFFTQRYKISKIMWTGCGEDVSIDRRKLDICAECMIDIIHKIKEKRRVKDGITNTDIEKE